MSDMDQFISSVNKLKVSLTCSYCSQLYKNPITFLKCFHSICAEHYSSLLKFCPECNTRLSGCKTFTDSRRRIAVESLKQLTEMIQCSDIKKKTIQTETEHKKRNSTIIVDENEDTEEDFEEPISKRKRSTKSAEESILNTSNITLSSKSNKTLEKKNTKGETSLHAACRHGKLNVVKDLLIKGACVNTKDNAGWTPLHEAVQKGRLDLVKLLLSYNCLIDVPGLNNETPLHEAVRYRNIDIIRELIRKGADVNARNCKGETPIQLSSPDIKKVINNALKNIEPIFSIPSVIEATQANDFEDLKIFCLSEQKSVLSKLKELTKHHNIRIESAMSKKITHIIVDVDDLDVCESSSEILKGIIQHIWIINSDWALKSTNKKLEPFEKYEVKGVGLPGNDGPKKSRINKYLMLPGIFNGCHFYLHNFRNKIEISKRNILTKNCVIDLILDGGGFILKRAPNPEGIPNNEKLVPYHAKENSLMRECSHYIIYTESYTPMYNMSHLKALPLNWLIQCIEKQEICDPW